MAVALLALSAPQKASATSEPQGDFNCVILSDALAIPEDGSWLPICLVDPNAPEGSTVTEMNVKILVDHPDPGQIKIRLTRMDSDVDLSLSSSEITKEGVGSFIQIHDFDGSPSQGEWVVRIRDTVPEVSGRIIDVSIAPFYTPIGELPIAVSENNGKPTSERVAADAVRITGGFESGEKNDAESPPEMQPDVLDTITIMNQSFEGNFPPSSGGWSIFDGNPNDGKEYYWDDDNLKPYGGSWAAWPARGGTDGIDPTLSTTYPKNMDTWMIYGPFDLSNAKSAQVAFMLWRHIEVNWDHIFFGISSDRVNFSGWSWSGDVGWENKTFSLSSYLGDSDVWICWHFVSDGSVQYEGPWIDDIALNFVPGDVTIQGSFTYADRSSTMQGAKGIKVQLWDRDTSGGDDLLAETIVIEGSGHYSIPTLVNWDTDDTDPILGNRRLDLYVLWVLENDDYKVTNSSGTRYAWSSSQPDNVQSGPMTISASLPFGYIKLEAMWIFQDIRHAREYYLSYTYPHSDPGYLTAHWDENQNSENGIQGSHFWAPISPHVYIAHDSRFSPDIVVHELGHHVMWNKTGQWLWYDFGCFQHEIFSQESVQCAWSEGWADFFAIAVNGDVCYDFDQYTCSGYDLENHTRNDPNAEGFWWGDGVEGRIAGTLYDLMDSANESPWYDNASWGFDPITDIALVGAGHSGLQQFWAAYQGTGKHNGVRSIYQNTIDYDQAPVFSAIPEQRILQNFPSTHLFDLWNYSSDAESPDASLMYSIVSVSDSRCGVSLDSHWVNANPQRNWVGSCYVTVRANDSIKTTTGSFWMHVLQINSRIFLPILMND